MTANHWWDAVDASSFFISGVVAKVLGEPREPPPVLDDDEASEWLKGWDA